MKPIISLQNISFSYDNGPAVLEDINLEIAQNEFLGIVGPNGGGKTTLLKLMMGLLKPLAGRISIFGTPPELARKEIGYVSQFKTFNKDFPIIVADIVLMGRLGKTAFFGGYTKHDKKIVHELLLKLEINDLYDYPIDSLSGGQLQRVMIARALCCEPKILLFDEPTASVDIHAEQNIFDFLKSINNEVTILVVSHDVGFISRYIKRVACVNKKLICHETAALTTELIQEIYDMPVRAIQHFGDKENV